MSTNTGQYKNSYYVDSNGLHFTDTQGYSAHYGTDGVVRFFDNNGFSVDVSSNSASATYGFGSSSVSVNASNQIVMSTDVGGGEIRTISQVGADGNLYVKEVSISGAAVQYGTRLLSVEVGAELKWTPNGWASGVDGQIAVAGVTITDIAEFAITSVENSSVSELFKTRREWQESGTGDSHKEWLRKRNMPRIDPSSNDKFKTALRFVQVYDPLALDLDSDGIETVSSDAGITFDFDGDGLKTGTGWVKGDDGFLVLDRNGNGSIDTGAELFGVDTVKANGQKASNGFDALRDLDGNADGVFDDQDEQFANVRVWQDLNQDGVAQVNELKSLAEHDITAVNLGSTATNQNSNGNLISAVGTFVRGDGSEGSVNGNQSLAANLDLATNPFYREHTDTIALSDSVKALSDMKGSGAVRDLREAAMLSSQLQSQLSQYNQASRPDQVGMLDTLLRTWAATADYRTWDQRIGDLGNDIVEVSFAYSWERATTDGIGSGASSSGSQAEIGSAKEDTGPTAEQLEKQQLLERVKILEIFNAQNFFNFSRDESSTDSGGDALVAFSLSSGANTRSRSMSAGGREVVLTEEDISINAGQAELLNKSYESLLHSLYKGLVVQAHLKPYLDVIGLVFSNAEPVLDFSATQQLFLQNAEQNPAETMLDIADFMSYMKFTGKDMLNWGSFTDRMLTSLSEADAVEFYRQVSLLPLPDEDESVRFGTHNSDSFKVSAP
ncbi:hypothetical protein [Pseudomonas anguilliseptica]|uniref:hypothetical protein n=1 Tax=Pseudomonas anguilliseptica TaxID=53406 RepID=UPI00325A45BC